eukprot:scaffold1_cov402-Prasinococcus_capsulatus_cf.AAC.1
MNTKHRPLANLKRPQPTSTPYLTRHKEPHLPELPSKFCTRAVHSRLLEMLVRGRVVSLLRRLTRRTGLTAAACINSYF